jgi:hypothetical protein
VTASEPQAPVVRSRRQRPRTAPLLVIPLLILAGLLAWYRLARPKLVFENRLAAPIWLTVGQSPPVSIPSGQLSEIRVAGDKPLVVQWNVARPLSADQRPMGEELRGSSVVREPKGTMYQRASARGQELAYFAPLITNATEDLLRVTVNAGLEGSVDCGCAVRPGARRVFIGYYRLYQNSTVRARDSRQRSASFRDLGPQVTAADGSVGLRFESKDFQ